MAADLLSLTPLIPAGASLAEELRFYTEHLGFTMAWQSDEMAGIRRGSVEFNLLQNENQEWAKNSSFSIRVSDLDALYVEYSAPPCRVRPLEIKPWGRREFHLIVPSGVCLQFCQ